MEAGQSGVQARSCMASAVPDWRAGLGSVPAALGNLYGTWAAAHPPHPAHPAQQEAVPVPPAQAEHPDDFLFDAFNLFSVK